MNDSPAPCVTCENFTIKPRASNLGMLDDWMAERDKKNVGLGLGRCKKIKESYIWIGAESARHCENYSPIAADQVVARRAYLAKRRG